MSSTSTGVPPTPSTPNPGATATASSPPKASSPQKPSQPTTAPSTHEERLSKMWRTLGTGAVQMISKSEKAAAVAVQQQGSTDNPAMKDAFREVDESVVQFLRARMEFYRLLSHVEAKLQGKAEEMESLDTYIKTEPKIGEENCNRKRKLAEITEGENTQKDGAAAS